MHFWALSLGIQAACMAREAWLLCLAHLSLRAFPTANQPHLMFSICAAQGLSSTYARTLYKG